MLSIKESIQLQKESSWSHQSIMHIRNRYTSIITKYDLMINSHTQPI